MLASIFEQVGIPIPNELSDRSISSVFKSTGLNWNVVQRPIAYNNGYSYIGLPNHVGNFRSDNDQFLGIVHPREYKVVQNIEAFDFIDQLTDFTFEKVGTFNGGKKVYVIGKTNEQIYIDGKDDPIDFYLTFLHGHDGKSGIKFLLSPIRMFCTNQMNLILKSSVFKYMIKHTGNVEMKLSQIQKAVNDSHLYIKELETTIHHMITQTPSRTIDQLTFDLFPIEEKDTDLVTTRKEEARSIIKELYLHKPDLQNYKNTTYGMVSAVSDYVSHSMPKRRTNSALDNQFIKNLEGNELILKTQQLLAA